jgi:hypothetical protein
MPTEHLLSTHIPENINGAYEDEWAGTSTNVLLVLETLTAATVSVSYKNNRYNTDRGKPNNLEKNVSQWYFVKDKSHMDWSRRESGPPWWKASN